MTEFIIEKDENYMFNYFNDLLNDCGNTTVLLCRSKSTVLEKIKRKNVCFIDNKEGFKSFLQ